MRAVHTRVREAVSNLHLLGSEQLEKKTRKNTLQPVVSSGSNLDHRIYSPARTAAADDDVELHVPGRRLSY